MQLSVAAAVLQSIDPGRIEDLARCQPAGALLVAAAQGDDLAARTRLIGLDVLGRDEALAGSTWENTRTETT